MLHIGAFIAQNATVDARFSTVYSNLHNKLLFRLINKQAIAYIFTFSL